MDRISKICLVLVIIFMTIGTAGASLTTNAKNWLAINAGTGNCFAGSGISYKDADGISHIGRTGDVVNSFFVAHLVGKDNAIIIFSTSYAQLKIVNGNVDLDLTDVGWAYNNDGGIGSTGTYCSSGPIPPVPELNTGTLTSIGIFGLFVVSRIYKR